MRQWGSKPLLMCQQHLLGEHLEHHMFVTSLNKGNSVQGYIDGNLLCVQNLRARHDMVVEEMLARGMGHYSPLPEFTVFNTREIDVVESIVELVVRCPNCLRLHLLDPALLELRATLEQRGHNVEQLLAQRRLTRRERDGFVGRVL